MSSRTTFDQLPPELLLCVCEYLSVTDIFFSFYGLNHHISRTIRDYRRDFILAQVPFACFDHTCRSVLPDIGANLRSLSISNEWTAVLSKVFLSHFGERLSATFPNLERLTLAAFISQSFSLFLDCLTGFTKLHELRVSGLFAEFPNPQDSEAFLYRILSANNGRLNTVSFDYFSTAFHVNTANEDIGFSNIQRLRIELNDLNDLHRLLSILPCLQSLHVRIHDESLNTGKNPPSDVVSTLKSFRLQSIRHFWLPVELSDVLKRMPNVEELSIDIDSYANTDFIDGRYIRSLTADLPLKDFRYLLRLQDSSLVDEDEILCTWQDFDQPFFYAKNDADDWRLVFFSSPCHLDDLMLPCPTARNKVFNNAFAPRVDCLYLYIVPKHISNVFPILHKCHRLRRLSLQVHQGLASESCPQAQPWTLPRLRTVSISNGSSVDLQDLSALLNAAPKLYTLNIDDELLQRLMNDSSVWPSVTAITHMSVIIRSSDSLDTRAAQIPKLTSVFPSLKYFYVWIDTACERTESLILAVLQHLTIWTDLVAFVVVGFTLQPEIVAQGLRQWTVEHSSLREEDAFAVDYFEKRFRLWR